MRCLSLPVRYLFLVFAWNDGLYPRKTFFFQANLCPGGDMKCVFPEYETVVPTATSCN